MILAMCFDGGMLITLLFFLLIAGVIVVTPVILVLIAFARWADGRQKRMAAEDLPVADAGSTLNF